MEAFTHGDHVVLDGSQDELARVAAALDDAADATDAAGRIRRGLDAGATRIAVERDGARDALRALRLVTEESGDGPTTATLADAIADCLED